MDAVEKLLNDIEIKKKIAALPFTPTGLWVVVERDPEQETTKGGLVIPSKYQVKTNRGTVLARGVGMQTDFGVMREINPMIQPGVVIQWDAGQMGHDIEVQGKLYTFVPSSVIVLVEKADTREKAELC